MGGNFSHAPEFPGQNFLDSVFCPYHSFVGTCPWINSTWPYFSPSSCMLKFVSITNRKRCPNINKSHLYCHPFSDKNPEILSPIQRHALCLLSVWNSVIFILVPDAPSMLRLSFIIPLWSLTNVPSEFRKMSVWFLWNPFNIWNNNSFAPISPYFSPDFKWNKLNTNS